MLMASYAWPNRAGGLVWPALAICARRLAVLAGRTATVRPLVGKTRGPYPRTSRRDRILPPLRDVLGSAGHVSQRGSNPTRICRGGGAAPRPAGRRAAMGHAARHDCRCVLPRPFRPATPGQCRGPGGRTGNAGIGGLASTAGSHRINRERTMKIGLVGYQGSGKSALFHLTDGHGPRCTKGLDR